ncbi:MAG: sugar phosphate isomerase/epimerase and 4-hydroxyphenylpyruvate domain-containing protein [Alphaproteobacteria bacterium]|nr:sugar phosphate isomerase/epimerase and 4-hydroxyphenylpyruvate domain-containing protein [Alphaproteobacteria bacterium]
MRRSIATVSLSGTLADKLEAAAAARFDAVEVFENDLLTFEGSARAARALAADLGLSIALYQPFRDLEGVPDEQFRRNVDRAERKFDVMQELGAPLMLVCSNAAGQAIDDDGRAAAQLAALAERAARRGLRIGYEALAWGSHVRTYGHAWRLVERAAHPHLGLIVDSFHTLALGDDPAGIAAIPGERIFFVQLADAPKATLDVRSWSRHLRCFPGQGEFDLAGFLAPVVRAGYAGPISLEIFNDGFRAAPARATALDGIRSLRFLEEQTRRRLAAEDEAAAAPAGRPARRAELFDPPPPPPLDGIAFIEFAVDDHAEASLTDWLRRLGFRDAGRHRSKDVKLYRQGDIAIVVNAERESFAHSYFLLHGPSVCALGLATGDDRMALNRGEAFAYSRFDGRVGPQESPIPAIRAPDGSLLYFVSAAPGGPGALDTDFIAEPAAPAPDAGLRTVDHLAQAVPAGQFGSWTLFYRAVLGLASDDLWLLPDPYGIVRSRAMANAERTLRFPLNVSESPDTATARTVSTFGGAGVHHIAFRCDDIFATVARLRANGVALLTIPANYYDDLAARFALDAAEVDRLRGASVLYDRVGDGVYLHAYTQAFDDRMFFEIVQRIDGYDSYGAANAPVRMAAQARRGRSSADLIDSL